MRVYCPGCLASYESFDTDVTCVACGLPCEDSWTNSSGVWRIKVLTMFSTSSTRPIPIPLLAAYQNIKERMIEEKHALFNDALPYSLSWLENSLITKLVVHKDSQAVLAWGLNELRKIKEEADKPKLNFMWEGSSVTLNSFQTYTTIGSSFASLATRLDEAGLNGYAGALNRLQQPNVGYIQNLPNGIAAESRYRRGACGFSGTTGRFSRVGFPTVERERHDYP